MRYLLLFVSAMASLMAVRWIYFRVLNFARHKNISDCPDNRKLQTRPVPVMGGVAVFFGFVFGALAGFAGMSVIGMHPVVNVLPVVPAMLIMMYIGFIDDNEESAETRQEASASRIHKGGDVACVHGIHRDIHRPGDCGGMDCGGV